MVKYFTVSKYSGLKWEGGNGNVLKVWQINEEGKRHWRTIGNCDHGNIHFKVNLLNGKFQLFSFLNTQDDTHTHTHTHTHIYIYIYIYISKKT